MSDIRYFSDWPIAYYWACTDENRVLFGAISGKSEHPVISLGYAQYIEDPKYQEFKYIDADPIEERYINATDRPSVDGFKYPELHPVNDVES